jgi:hypothetical protein
MALDFTNAGSAKNVSVTAAASINSLTTLTYLAWVYRTGTDTSSPDMFNKGAFPDSRKEFGLSDSAGTLRGVIDRATTDCTAVSTTSINTNEWSCVAMTYSEANGIKMYYGTLSTALSEVSYASQVTGSGATGDDSATAQEFGGRSAGTANANFPGYIATVSICNAEMSLAEIQRQQFRPQITSSCVLYQHFGYNGTGTQADWSGNLNNGTVTTATVTQHVPLTNLFGSPAGWRGAIAPITPAVAWITA